MKNLSIKHLEHAKDTKAHVESASKGSETILSYLAADLTEYISHAISFANAATVKIEMNSDISVICLLN